MAIKNNSCLTIPDYLRKEKLHILYEMHIHKIKKNITIDFIILYKLRCQIVCIMIVDKLMWDYLSNDFVMIFMLTNIIAKTLRIFSRKYRIQIKQPPCGSKW